MGEGQGGEVEVESSFWGEVWSSRGGVDGGNGRTSATLLYLNPTHQAQSIMGKPVSKLIQQSGTETSFFEHLLVFSVF